MVKCFAKILLTAVLINSHTSWGQSILSLHYPFGLPVRPLTGTGLSMGGTSVGIANDHTVMLANPGNLGAINTTAFSASWMVDYLRAHDGNAYTDHISAQPRQLSFALPLGPGGTMAFSLTKTSDATMKYRQEQLLYSASDPLNSTFTRISYDREGGTTVWQAGWGHTTGKYLNIGLAYKRLYYTETGTKLSDIIFQKKTPLISKIDSTSNPPVRDTTYDHAINEDVYTELDSSHISFSSNGIQLGLLGTIKKLSVGLSVEYFFSTSLFRTRGIYNIKNNDAMELSSESTLTPSPEIQLPPVVSMGLSYAFSEKWLAGSDLSINLWKYYKIGNNAILSAIDRDNTISFSGGFQFIPAPNLLAPKYWETIQYSAGARYTQMPGGRSSEAAASCGFGFPLKGNGLLDLGFELGKRQDALYNNYHETFFHIAIGLNGGKKWNKTPSSSY